MLQRDHKARENMKECETQLSMTRIDEQKMENIEEGTNIDDIPTQIEMIRSEPISTSKCEKHKLEGKSDPDPPPSDSSDSSDSSSSDSEHKRNKRKDKKNRRKHRKDDLTDPSSSDDSDDSDSSEDGYDESSFLCLQRFFLSVRFFLLCYESGNEESDESDGGGSGSDFTFDLCFSHFDVELCSDRIISI